ncbi:serine hydrolase domain-containing protein [Maricaulis sp.]|uniref:serine hydrolase domain-containing protein n=1 Tax=Maricaulis sp. TaxID=1486257 RepID=UPI002627EF3D|nr:serine hydrolase domain-containing protein [Maricaulis sp.]
MIPHFPIAAACALACSTAVPAETPQGAAERLDAFLDRFGGIEPGYAVVVVTADDVVMNRIEGVRHAGTGAPLTADTPIYIASQTKAYMGLLAAYLDARGVLLLESTIADHWPDIEFPEGVDPAQWTLRDLLTHQVPVSVDELVTLEAYVTRVDPADYPALIARYGEAREPGYDYDNLGYNIYGAILETVTGRTWQNWLDEVVFDPLGLARTSARTSDFAADELAWYHTWLGEEDGWYIIPPKTDGMMQSAGGIVTSTGDMATWLQLQLRGEGPAGSGLGADIVSAAQTAYVETHMEDGRNAYELPCTGYSLGWNVCDFDGHTLMIHGGGYTGARTVMAYSPDLGVGIAAFSNSDNQTGWLSGRTVVMYLQYLTEHEDAERWTERRIEHYPERIARLLDYRRSGDGETRAEARWEGWAWQPSADELGEYVGRYSRGDGYHTIDIALRDAQLLGFQGDRRVTLEAARPDLFGLETGPLYGIEAVRFGRDGSGTIVQLDWEGAIYRRVD